MKYYKVSKLLTISLVILTLASACAKGPFTIKDKKFEASDICDAEGLLELRMEDSELKITARTAIKTFMRKSGFPSAWCHGVRHVWIGTATHAGYTFESSPDDPLRFVVDRDKGYFYEQGTGTVTTPDGKVVVLP